MTVPVSFYGQEQTIEIFGTITGESKDKIYLFFENDMEHGDSLSSNIKNGKFYFKVTAPLPILCRIHFKENTQIQEFYIDNNTFKFICDFLETSNSKGVDPHYILARLADTLDGQEFTSHTLCPICKHRQRNFMDNFRKRMQDIPFVTWHAFESITEENKGQLISEIINNKI